MTESLDNLSRQVDEIEALSSIYDESFKIEDEANRSYSIVIELEDKNNAVTLFFQFPEDYPSLVPPSYQVSAPWLKGLNRDHIGETVIFQWVEKLRDVLQAMQLSNHNEVELLKTDAAPCQLEEEVPDAFPDTSIEIVHGEVIVDRKSTFQGHVASITCSADVHSVLRTLYSNKKIANATHNMYAYRINRGGSGNFLQDCEDDGESQAGGRLLHLLQILDVPDVVVVVTRWYGGVHLGPDRFRHINNAARQVLQKAQLLPSDESSYKSSSKLKKII